MLAKEAFLWLWLLHALHLLVAEGGRGQEAYETVYVWGGVLEEKKTGHGNALVFPKLVPRSERVRVPVPPPEPHRMM